MLSHLHLPTELMVNTHIPEKEVSERARAWAVISEREKRRGNYDAPNDDDVEYCLKKSRQYLSQWLIDVERIMFSGTDAFDRFVEYPTNIAIINQSACVEQVMKAAGRELVLSVSELRLELDQWAKLEGALYSFATTIERAGIEFARHNNKLDDLGILPFEPYIVFGHLKDKSESEFASAEDEVDETPRPQNIPEVRYYTTASVAVELSLNPDTVLYHYKNLLKRSGRKLEGHVRLDNSEKEQLITYVNKVRRRRGKPNKP